MTLAFAPVSLFTPRAPSARARFRPRAPPLRSHHLPLPYLPRPRANGRRRARMSLDMSQPPSEEEVRVLILSPGKAEQQRGLLLVRRLPPATALELLLLSLSSSQNEFIRATAAIGLGQLRLTCADERDEAVRALVALLNGDAEYSVRSSAAAGMGYLDELNPGARGVLLEALTRAVFEDTEWQVQFSALAALGNLKDARAVPVLLPCLRSENDLLVQAAVGALGEIGDRSVIPRLLELLGSKDMMTRQRLAQGLGLMDGCRDEPAVIDALRTLSKDQSFAVRDAANASLQRFGCADPAKKSALSDVELMDREVQNLLSGDEHGEAELTAGDALRRRLERSFDKECVEGATPPDATSSQDSIDPSMDGEKRDGRAGVDSGEYTALVNNLKHGSLSEQTLAAIKLRRCSEQQVFAAVMDADALDPQRYPIRVRSLSVRLLALAGAMEKILETLANDPEENVRSACCDAAAEAGGGDAAVAGCIRAFEHDPKWLVRISAAIALGSIGKGRQDVEDSLIRSLEMGGVADLEAPQDSVIRRHAVTALGFLGSKKSLKTMKKMVENEETEEAVRFRIAAALRGMHCFESVEIVRMLINDASTEVSEMAQGSLDSLAQNGFK